MHTTKHATIIGAVLLALVATVVLRDTVAVGSVAQPREAGQRASERNIRIATVDIYLISERIMQQPALLRARERADERFLSRLGDIEDELRQMEAQLQALQQNDPQVQRILERAQTLQTTYQSIQQERQVELEGINSRQLIEAFTQTQQAANRVAREMGYTHVFSSRAADRPIETETVGSTLQEMLARPLIVGFEEDDLTDAILDDLDLDAPAEPAADGEGAPGALPGADPGR